MAACTSVLAALGCVASTIPATAAPDWSAVGRVNVSGLSFCTGTLIAPDLAVTAAHCLFHPRTGRMVPLDEIHFVAGWDRGGFVAHAQPTSVHVAVGYDWSKREALPSLERDVAILHFATPVAAPSLGVLADTPAARDLRMVHYSRLKPHLADVDEGCLKLGMLGRLWRIDCEIEPGGSGAPVLVVDAGEQRVAAIVIGRTRVDGVWATLALPMSVPEGLPLP